MIDTVKIKLMCPKVYSKDSGLIFMTKSCDNNKPHGLLLEVNTGKEILSKVRQAYYKDDLIHVNVNKEGVFFVQFSISKVMNRGGANVGTYSLKQLEETLEYVEKELLLGKIGVRCNIFLSTICRLDMYTDAETDYGFLEYKEIFDLMRFKRQKELHYGTTFLYMNSQRAHCIYDKKEECRYKGYDVSCFPKNLIRWEYRLKNGRVIFKELGVRTLQDLLDNAQSIKQYYLDRINEAISSVSLGDATSELGSLNNEIEDYLRKPGDIKAFSKYIVNKGLEGFLLKMGTIEQIREYLDSKGFDRVQICRVLKKARNVKMLCQEYRSVPLADMKNNLLDNINNKINQSLNLED